MSCTICEIGADRYAEYATIDPSYEVASVLKVVPRDGGLGGLEMVEESVECPYRKGADSAEDSPSSWPPRDEPGEFAAFLAMDADLAIGAAAVVVNPQGTFLFERHQALAGLVELLQLAEGV